MTEPAAAPIPLADPSGVVRAWACGACAKVADGYIHSSSPKAVANAANASQKGAASCCRCRECGGLDPRPGLRSPVRSGPIGMCQKCWDDTPGKECRARMDAAVTKHRERSERHAASFGRALDGGAARDLHDCMSGLSEEHYSASWLRDCEFALWSMVHGGPRAWGFGEVTEGDVAELKRLSEAAGGWWTSDVFLPLAEWLPLYEAETAKWAAEKARALAEEERKKAERAAQVDALAPAARRAARDLYVAIEAAKGHDTLHWMRGGWAKHLWAAIHDAPETAEEDEDGAAARARIPVDVRGTLRRLAEEAGGWWCDNRLVPTAEWVSGLKTTTGDKDCPR